MITDKIIEYAREFHEMGGTDNWKIDEWAWFILNDPTSKFYGEVHHIPEQEKGFINRHKAIPILTESELWELLIKQNLMLLEIQDCNPYKILIMIDDITGRNIIIDSLHEALYSAAVWVAKKKANVK